MLYFWLTSAVHQANRASMESVDQLSFIKRRKKLRAKIKNRKKYQSESDLTNVSASSPAINRQRANSQTTASTTSLNSTSF